MLKRLTFFALLCILLSPCTGDPNHEVRDLEDIRQKGVLRVLTRNNANSYFVWRGRRMGFDYELAERFATQLGVKLEIIIPKDWNEMIAMLREGKADIIAASMTVTPERQKKVRFAQPYMKTYLQVVWKKGAPPLKHIDELAGQVVHVREHSSYYEYLIEFSKRLARKGLPPLKIVPEAEDRETEQILSDIASGKIPYTICDHHIALVNQNYLTNLEIGPALNTSQPLAWAVSKNSRDLAKEIDQFFSKIKKEPTFNILYRRYYSQPRHHARRKNDRLYSTKTKQISPYDKIIQRVAEKYGFDWRLLVAQIYQESKFDPNARSWSGASGLYQIMPRTAEELGIEDPENPEQSITGGAKYLAQMFKRLEEIADDEERLKMALAAYNCGLGHLTDARELAEKKDDLDPQKWEDVGKALLLLSQREYAAQAKYGYVRGSEPVEYVSNIWDFYRAYKHTLGERDI